MNIALGRKRLSLLASMPVLRHPLFLLPRLLTLAVPWFSVCTHNSLCYRLHYIGQTPPEGTTDHVWLWSYMKTYLTYVTALFIGHKA